MAFIFSFLLLILASFIIFVSIEIWSRGETEEGKGGEEEEEEEDNDDDDEEEDESYEEEDAE